ncbi:MAG TPA: GTP 3',8-cyclase MoaA [Firmicutes bacterium]|nr:GTP 3',8-cyclase MoaA [Bacillota bacterium]
MSDALGRNIHYLRVSVTDRCNFRCTYCMPPGGVQWIPHEEILRYQELIRIIRVAAQIGINKVRITGGEPLVRRGIVSFIHEVAQLPGIEDLSMTTNASLLAENVAALKKAGLSRVNISLDTLRADRFEHLCGRDVLSSVLAGIEQAQAAGLTPVKINMVGMKGVNDDELADFARMTLDKPYEIRFIEHMPFRAAGGNKMLLPVAEMQAVLAAQGFDKLIPEAHGDGPADVYRVPGALGTLGFISPVTRHFCEECNRIRLTADGRIKPCLLSNQEYNIKQVMRAGCSDDELADYLRDVILHKPSHHHLDEEPTLRRGMSKIGG